MKRTQLTITYPVEAVKQLEDLKSWTKAKQWLNRSAFCREAIAEKLEKVKEVSDA